jgi:hypothetical protein
VALLTNNVNWLLAVKKNWKKKKFSNQGVAGAKQERRGDMDC